LFALQRVNKPVSPLQKEINDFEHIVDSFLQVNQDFRESYDTMYQEVAIDPTDAEITKIDTIIFGPNNKKSIFFAASEGGHPFSDAYRHTYNYRTELLDSLMSQMSEKQRTEILSNEKQTTNVDAEILRGSQLNVLCAMRIVRCVWT
jgi:hypothetical protein